MSDRVRLSRNICALVSRDGISYRETPQMQRGGMFIPALMSDENDNGGIGRRLLNVGEAAHYLGISVDTLHKWVQLRAIPHVKAGRALRFDLVALNRYIDEHTIGTID